MRLDCELGLDQLQAAAPTNNIAMFEKADPANAASKASWA